MILRSTAAGNARDDISDQEVGATQHEAPLAAVRQLWALRESSELWRCLLARIGDDGYRRGPG